MYCTKCGAVNTDDAKFCVGCGAPLTDDAGSTAATATTAGPAAGAHRMTAQDWKETNKGWTTAIIAMIAVAIVAVIVGIAVR